MFFYYWGPLLCRDNIDDNLFDYLTEFVNSPKNNSSRFIHNIQKIENEYELSQEEKNQFDKLFKPYIKNYVNIFNNAWQPNNKPISDNFDCVNVWINYQKKNENRSLHMHTECDISFVIYYDIPDVLKEEAVTSSTDVVPGAITFYNELSSPSEPLLSNNKIVTHLPSSREVFIFPSHLNHTVNSFESDCTRISIAGNYKLNER